MCTYMEKSERVEVRCSAHWRDRELKMLARRRKVSEAEAIRQAVVEANNSDMLRNAKRGKSLSRRNR